MREIDDRSQFIETTVKTISESLYNAEKHLGVSPGTISNLAREPDYIFLMKTIAVIEPLLNNLIKTELTRPVGGLGGQSNADRFGLFADLLADNLQLNGRVSKISVAKSLNLITKNESNFVLALSSMRNRYAHNIINTEKTILDIYKLCEKDNEAMFKHLTLSSGSNMPDNFGVAEIKLLILYSLAIFLEKNIKIVSMKTTGVSEFLKIIAFKN